MNLNLMAILEQPEGIRDGSSSLFKGNLGTMYHTPYRFDITVMGNYTGAQQWRQRAFDSSGQIELNVIEVDPRLLLSTRLAGRPFPSERLELAFTLWNISAFRERQVEHPKGQQVGPRAYGSMNYRF